MDPLSIAVSSASLAQVAFTLSKNVYYCVEEIRSVDSNLRILAGEILALSQSLETVDATFRERRFNHLYQEDKTGDKRLFNLCVNLNQLLEDCEGSLALLQTAIEGIRKPTKAFIPTKPMQALRLNLKRDEIALIQHRIQSYHTALEITLVSININLTADGNSDVVTLSADLKVQLGDLESKLDQIHSNIQKQGQVNSSSEDIPKELLEDDVKKQEHLDKYREAAFEIYSHTSSYLGSIAGTIHTPGASSTTNVNDSGSVMGLNDYQTERISDWMTNGGNKSTPKINAVKKRRVFADKLAGTGDHASAEVHYQRALKEGEKLDMWDASDQVGLLIQLSKMAISQEKFKGAQEYLESASVLEGLPEDKMLEVQHRKALTFLRANDIDSARACGEIAFEGRWEIFGDDHELFYETAKLMADICEAGGDRDEAAYYLEYLGSQKPKQIVRRATNLAANTTQTNEMPEAVVPEKPKPYEITREEQRLLKETRANFNIGPTRLNLRFLDACKDGKITLAKLLLSDEIPIKVEQNNKNAGLLLAVKAKSSQLVQTLLENGADVATKGSDNWDSLMLASRDNEREICEVLLANGAEINKVTENGWTALMTAVEAGNLELSEYLINRGGDVNVRENNGWSSVMIACRDNRKALLELLIKYKADINGMNNTGWNALMTATEKGHHDIVEILCKAGADTESREPNGWPSLMMASRDGFVDIIKILLDHKADIHAAEPSRWNSLMISAQNGFPDVVELLLDRGADPHIKLESGQTALTLAKEKGNREVELLLETAMKNTPDRHPHPPPESAA